MGLARRYLYEMLGRSGYTVTQWLLPTAGMQAGNMVARADCCLCANMISGRFLVLVTEGAAQGVVKNRR